jgi:hypothetical protein
MNDQKPVRIQLGGLWRNKTEKGNEYLSGPFGNAYLQIWPNKKRDGHDKDPDFTMCLVPKIKKEKEAFSLDIQVNREDSQDPGPAVTEPQAVNFAEIPF